MSNGLVIFPADENYVRYDSRIVTDRNDVFFGWKIIGYKADGNYRECFFDTNGNLRSVTDTDNFGGFGETKIHPRKSIHYDVDGNVKGKTVWDYLPEDGLGWDFYATEYDADGKEIDSEWNGQA